LPKHDGLEPSCSSGRVPPQIRRRQVQLRKGDTFDLIESYAGQILAKHRRVTDQDDRQLVGMEVLLRHTLDVVDADRIHAFAVRLQLVEIEAVEHRVQDLKRNRARRFDGQRKTPGQIFLRVG
jgi:hypothetical protein